jgi:hypothetical protein
MLELEISQNDIYRCTRVSKLLHHDMMDTRGTAHRTNYEISLGESRGLLWLLDLLDVLFGSISIVFSA